MTSQGITAILLAAGFSRRMGTLKALLSWKGIPLIQYQIEQLQAAGVKHIIVVLGHKAQLLNKVIAPYDVEIVFNEQYKEGKSTSIRKGVSHVPDLAQGVIVSAVDQPVPSETLLKFIQYYHEKNSTILIPTYEGKSGHPILLSGKLKKELLAINERTKGLRKVIRSHVDEIDYKDFNDPSILLNLNEPADYVT